jgi:hypothetical protein
MRNRPCDLGGRLVLPMQRIGCPAIQVKALKQRVVVCLNGLVSLPCDRTKGPRPNRRKGGTHDPPHSMRYLVSVRFAACRSASHRPSSQGNIATVHPIKSATGRLMSEKIDGWSSKLSRARLDADAAVIYAPEPRTVKARVHGSTLASRPLPLPLGRLGKTLTFNSPEATP